MLGINEYLEACQYRKGFLADQHEWLYQERHQYDLDVERLEGELDRVRQEMAGYLLPEVNDSHLKELESVGFDGLTAIKSDYDGRFTAAERRRKQLEEMDEVEHYEKRILEARRLVDEIQPRRNELRGEFMHWSNSKWYSQLDQRGYFEEDYWPSFFNKFWDWRAVSFLMEDIERDCQLEFEDPDQLKRHYRKLQGQYNEVIPMYQDRVAQRDRIQELKDEHFQCLTAPERLLGELYSELGAKILERMRMMPQAKREEMASLDANLNTFMKKELGLMKQVQYLRELTVSRVDASAQRVEQETQKIDAKIHKLEMKRMRGKHKWYSQEDIDRMRAVKAEKWAKRRVKTEKIRRKISDFNRYDDGSIQEDFLWWDLITNSSYGDDVYEVREHRQRFPNWDHRRFRDPWDDDDDHVDASIDVAADDLVASMADQNDAGLFDGS